MEHASAESNSPPPARKRPLSEDASIRTRKRNATACSVCRSRKTKCDNKKPQCSYCMSIGAACDSEEPLGLRQRLTTDSQAILDRIDRLEQNLLQRNGANHSHSHAAQDVAATASVTPTPIVHGTTRIMGSKAYFTVESVLAWPVFEGQYKSCLNLREVIAQGRATLDQTSPKSGRVSVLPVGLEIDSCSKYLDNFFSRIHIKNPVLDEKEIRQWARDLTFNGFGWDARSCLVITLCALGAISMPFSGTVDGLGPKARDSEDHQLAEAWFEASQKRIGTLLSRGGGILEAQCFFFSGVYLMHTFRPFAAWLLFVQALACCQTFQCFGDDGEQAISHTSDQGAGIGWRTAESIYWTCFKSELETRCQLTLPGFNISDLSYPDFLPSPPPESVEKQDQAWFFYLAEIALRQLANQVLSHILPFSNGQQIYDLSVIANVTLDFEEQAQKWSQLLPPEVDIQSTAHSQDVLRFILRVHLMACYESIYWPYLATAINFPIQRDRSFDLFVQKGLQNCVDKIWVAEAGFHHRHHGTWLSLRQCTRSALVLVAAKRCGQLDHLIPRDWILAVKGVITFLEFWSLECADAGNRRDILEDALRNVPSLIS